MKDKYYPYLYLMLYIIYSFIIRTIFLLKVKIPDGDGNNANMIFNAVGSSVATGSARFGGLVFVYTTRDILFWKPKSSLGHMVYIGGVWGSGLSSQHSDTVQVLISVIYLSGNIFCFFIRNNSSNPVSYILIVLVLMKVFISVLFKYKKKKDYNRNKLGLEI